MNFHHNFSSTFRSQPELRTLTQDPGCLAHRSCINGQQYRCGMWCRLKYSDVSEEHDASIFRIPSGEHIQYVCPKHRYSTRLRDITFWKTDHKKYPKLAVSRILSARTDQYARFSHGVACDDCWKVTHDWKTDDKEGRTARVHTRQYEGRLESSEKNCLQHRAFGKLVHSNKL
jgi:hypothetical protein